MFAHVIGMPVEEVLASAGGAGASLLVARVWLVLLVRRRFGRDGGKERELASHPAAARLNSASCSVGHAGLELAGAQPAWRRQSSSAPRGKR